MAADCSLAAQTEEHAGVQPMEEEQQGTTSSHAELMDGTRLEGQVHILAAVCLEDACATYHQHINYCVVRLVVLLLSYTTFVVLGLTDLEENPPC